MSKRDRGKFDHGNYSAPWREQRLDGELGPEYLPISARTGRAVSQSTAERDWAESFDAVPTPQHGHGAGGLWDREAELAARSTRRLADGSSAPVPVRQVQLPERYDGAKMRTYAARFGSELTPRQWEIYSLFWLQRLSYKAIGRRLACRWERVYETIKMLRVRAHGIR